MEKKLLLSLAILLLLKLCVYAQRYEQVEGRPIKPIITDGAFSVYEGHFSISGRSIIKRFNMDVDPTPGYPQSGDEYKYIFRHTDIEGKVIYGIKDWWQVEVSGNWHSLRSEDADSVLGETTKDDGFGGTTLQFRHIFFSKDSYSDLGLTYGIKFADSERKNKFSYLKTSQHKVAPFQYGGNDYFGGFHFTSVLERGIISGDLKYVWTGDFTNRFSEVEDPGNYIEYNIGYVYPLNRLLNLVLEVNGSRHYTTRINDVKQPLSDYNYIFFSPGIEISLGEDLLLMGSFSYPLTYKLPFEDLKDSDDNPIIQDKELDSWVSFGLYYLY